VTCFITHNNKIDLQAHLRSLIRAIQHAKHDFLLVFHYNYVLNLHRFRDIITYFPKFQEVTRG